jgi:hypothetical protein
MTVDDSLLGPTHEPTMASVKQLTEAVRRNKGNIQDLGITDVIRELGYISNNGSAPEDVRQAAADALRLAKDNSVKFTAKKIIEASKRKRNHVSNPLARDGMRSKGTVKPPSKR